MVIDITADSSSATNISPVTISMTLSSTASTMSPLQSSKRTRRSSKQASENKHKSKRTKVEYDNRYKAAFEEATNLIAEKTTEEPVGAMCQRLNKAFGLDGKKRLVRSTVFTAYKDGIAGTSPKKKGSAPKIQHEFLETVATHAEVCQVGDGELRGKDLRRLIGASIVGTAHTNLYKAESV